MDEANGLLPNDTLTLFCEVRHHEHSWYMYIMYNLPKSTHYLE